MFQNGEFHVFVQIYSDSKNEIEIWNNDSKMYLKNMKIYFRLKDKQYNIYKKLKEHFAIFLILEVSKSVFKSVPKCYNFMNLY